MSSPDRKRGLAVACAILALALLAIWIGVADGGPDKRVAPEPAPLADERAAGIEAAAEVLQPESERRPSDAPPREATEKGQDASQEVIDRYAGERSESA